jgi:transcriptional regulator GlxA family with amidase domain
MSDLTIGILLFPDAEELDWVGPFEVFSVAAMGKELDVVTIAQTTEPVRCANGLRVLPDHDFANAPKLDVVLVPGGQGTNAEMDNSELIDWLSAAAAPCSWVTSVCTGSVLLHRAGLASGCVITTHWGYVETLRELAPDATVRDDIRYVRDGRLVTSAGVSAGIDMSLWLVGELYGAEHARQTRKWMQYDPEPPY